MTKAKKDEEPILCDDCGTEVEEIGPDMAFGNQWYCPKCKEYFAGAY